MQYDQFERLLNLFVAWCREELGYELYRYQLRIARACLSSVFIEPKDVYIKIARQAGKTETVTLLVRYLIVFYRKITGEEVQVGIASPKGEIAKTDIDRIKKSILKLQQSWGIEDRENNAETIRAYVRDQLNAEIFKFSLGPNSTNESKTLKILIVEEAHKCNDKKRADELDPMLTATDGVTWFIGVGCTRKCDFKQGCDGKVPDSERIIVDADEVCRDRREMFDRTGDPKHLKYERTFQRILKKKGRGNAQVKLNYLLIDDVEQGNFVSEAALKSCARPAGAVVPSDKLYFGIDWGRKKDHTWVVLVNAMCDIVDMLKVPHMRYEKQIEEIVAWLTRHDYYQRIYAVRGDSTGQGDMPMEFLEDHTRLPLDEESHVKFGMVSKHVMYTGFQEAMSRDPSDERRFSYPSDHPLAAEFEEQMLGLLREYRGDGEYLAVNHDEEDEEAHDDVPDATALALLAASGGGLGEILVG